MEEAAYDTFFCLKEAKSIEETQSLFKEKIKKFYECAEKCMNKKIDTTKLPFHKIYVELDPSDEKNTVENAIQFTDNHSSKQLPLEILSRDQEIDPRSIIQRAIYLGDTADRYIYKKKEGDKQQKGIFLFKKYLALYLIKLCEMVDLHRKLINPNNISFSDIRFLATLGNHDYGPMLIQDFNNIGLTIDKESIKKICSLCRYFIPTELVIKEDNLLHVFSHSGGTCLLPKEGCHKEETNHKDFKMVRTFILLIMNNFMKIGNEC